MQYSEIRKHVKDIVDDYDLNVLFSMGAPEDEYEVEIQGISHFIEKNEENLNSEILSDHIQLVFNLMFNSLFDISDCVDMANDIIKRLKEVDSCFGCEKRIACQKVIDCHNITLCEVDVKKLIKVGRRDSKFNQSMKKIKSIFGGK